MQRIIHTFRYGTGLRARLFRGGAWLASGTVAEHGLRLVRNMILTRLLAPEAFGLMAIVLSVNSLFQVITGIGIREAVVQNPKGAERTFLNGAWALAVARSTFLYVVAFVAAPVLAAFYRQPELTALLRVAFLNVLAMGALSAGAFVAVKQMRYRPWTIIQQGGSCLGVMTAVALAFHLRGVWALVVGFATEGIARCVLSYIICPFRPRWQFEPDHWRALLRYARGVFGLPVLMLIYTDGGVFVMGKLISAGELGIFSMALALARLPTFAGNLVGELMLPAFSEIQHDSPRVNRMLLRTTCFIGLAGFPALGFACSHGSSLLRLVYGAAYAEAALAFKLLMANELLTLCCVPLASIYYAIGQPALLRRFSLIRAAVVLLFIYPGIRFFGLVGAATVPLLAMIVGFAFQLLRMRRITGLALRAYGAALLPGLLVCLPLLASWTLLDYASAVQTPLLKLVQALLVAGLLWLAFVIVLLRRRLLRV